MDFSICLLDPGLDSHIWSRGLVYLHQHCFPVNTTNHTAIQPSNHQRPGIRYSSTVVAPMQRNSPRASMGFLLAIQQLDSGQMSNVFQCHDIVIQIIPFKFIAVSFFSELFGEYWCGLSLRVQNEIHGMFLSSCPRLLGGLGPTAGNRFLHGAHGSGKPLSMSRSSELITH